MRYFLICGLAILSASSVNAAPIDRTPYYTSTIGTGTLSCGEFVQAKDAKNEEQLSLFVQWAWGFMSAYNMRNSFVPKWRGVTHVGDLRALPDQPTVILFGDKYCHEHPTDTFMDATVGMIGAYGGNVIWKLPK